jgi:hypothetical protein
VHDGRRRRRRGPSSRHDLHAMRPEEAADDDKEAVEAEDDDKGNYGAMKEVEITMEDVGKGVRGEMTRGGNDTTQMRRW